MSEHAELQLNDRQEAYLAWLCTPPAEREPSSKIKYSEQNRVAAQTLRNWEKNKNFRAAWKERVELTQASPERTQTLMDSLYERGLAGDMKAADLYLKATGRMVPPPIKVEQTTTVRDLTDDELAALVAQQARAQMTARQQQSASTPFATVGGAQ